MKKIILACILVGMLVCATAAFADSVTGTTGAWQAFDSGAFVIDNNGVPYYDNPSLEGANKNVGFLLKPQGVTSWWGNGDGSADTEFHFVGAMNNVGTELRFELAGRKNVNVFGYYDSSGNHVLYNGPDSPIATATFKPASNDYGFFMTTTGGVTYYTESSKNIKDKGLQHFAAFQGPSNTFWLGAEDTLLAGADGDYNDMVVKITTVPEPSSLLALASTSVGALGYFLRRRRNSA